MSGRELSKLPYKAIIFHTYGETCTMDEALTAMEEMVRDLDQETKPSFG